MPKSIKYCLSKSMKKSGLKLKKKVCTYLKKKNDISKRRSKRRSKRKYLDGISTSNYKHKDKEYIHVIEFNDGRRISGIIEFCYDATGIVKLKEFREIFKFDTITSITNTSIKKTDKILVDDTIRILVDAMTDKEKSMKYMFDRVAYMLKNRIDLKEVVKSFIGDCLQNKIMLDEDIQEKLNKADEDKLIEYIRDLDFVTPILKEYFTCITKK